MLVFCPAAHVENLDVKTCVIPPKQTGIGHENAAVSLRTAPLVCSLQFQHEKIFTH